MRPNLRGAVTRLIPFKVFGLGVSVAISHFTNTIPTLSSIPDLRVNFSLKTPEKFYGLSLTHFRDISSTSVLILRATSN